MTRTQDFYVYAKGFYGRGGIYEFDAPHNVIYAACCLVAQRKDIHFDGDTVDREAVRETLERFGYSEVTERPLFDEDHVEQRDLSISISRA